MERSEILAAMGELKLFGMRICTRNNPVHYVGPDT